MPRPTTAFASNHLDQRVLQILLVVNRLCLIVVTLVSGLLVSAWLISPLRELIPAAWGQISVVSAMCGLLSALSLSLSVYEHSANEHSTYEQSTWSVLLSRAAATAVILLGGLSNLFPIGTPGLATLHANAAFMLLGILLLCLRVRRSVFSECVDAFTVVLCALMLLLIYSNVFAALHLANPALHLIVGPPAMFSLALLAFVAFNHRAEYGVFSVLLGSGIGGKTARSAAPFALALPILRSFGKAHLPTEYVTAASSLIAFCFLLIICRRINRLEQSIRDLSLRDELTGLYNRRGFYVLAEQAFRLAQRAREPFSVLFLDLDNLKATNDLAGHDAGSILLSEMAAVLLKTFRETDVVARLGGDEFVVAGKASAQDIQRAVGRLAGFAADSNLAAGSERLHSLSFSVGHISTDHLIPTSLEELVQHADLRMYQTKRLRKSPASARPAAHTRIEELATNQV